MHGRSQIRAAIATALSAATSGGVYIERANRLGAEDLPAMIVYMGEDSQSAGERAMGQSYDVEVDQQIQIELHAVGATGASVATPIDDMDEELEQILANDGPLGSLIEILSRESSAYELSIDQDRVYGLRTVTYVATWRHQFGAPDAPEGD